MTTVAQRTRTKDKNLSPVSKSTVKPKTIKKVLMCRPIYFNVDYVINPHMLPYSVDEKLALKQWKEIVATLEKIGVKVEVIDQEPDVPDMVFATDQGIVRDGAALLANFRYSQRQKERIYYRKWFRDNGYRLRALSNIFPFEGGDTLFLGDALFVGVGFRASVSSCEELSQKLEIDVMPIRLMDPYFYHLDMGFLPIDDTTAFYYPEAFSKNSQHLMRRIIPNLIKITREDAMAYACNSFVSGKHILISKGTSDSFKNKLKKRGLTIHELDISEFKKAGGGIHCLINVLEYS